MTRKTNKSVHHKPALTIADVSEMAKRRRIRFGLRTMFVMVTLSALVAGWIVRSLDWIRQRREFGRNLEQGTRAEFVDYDRTVGAPGLLWLFGEGGIRWVFIPNASESDLAEGRRLFPEAKVFADPKEAMEGEER
jgi:hypothetical protein